MNRLKEYLKASGLTQAKLADALGVTPMGVSHYVNGRTPNLRTCRAIVESINSAGVSCSLEDVFPPSEQVA